MPMLESFRTKHRTRLLGGQKDAPRRRSIKNLADVQMIGIICQPDDDARRQAVVAFARAMEEQGKEVHLLALLPPDKAAALKADHPRTTAVRPKADFNFWGLPKWGVIKGFATRRFDLLIDAVGGTSAFAQYSAQRTPAALRVTCAREEDQPCACFDLFFSSPQSLDLKTFFSLVVKYLSMIKK